MKNIPKNIGFLLQFVIGLNQRKFYLRRLYHEKSFLRKMLSVTMALAMAAGAACSTAAVAGAAQTDVVPLTAVQELTNESTISANVILYGKSVTVNAKASGGTGGYTYTVLYKKKSSDVWTVKQKLSENTKVEITPAVQTDYKICVKVIDSSGEVVKKYFNLKVNHELQNNSVISRTTVPYGESLKVYGRAEGGIGTYLYAVYYKKASDTNWTTKQKYDRNTVVPIKPAKVIIGVGLYEKNGRKYWVQIFARLR